MNEVLTKMYEDLLELPSKMRESILPVLCLVVQLSLLASFVGSVCIFLVGSVAAIFTGIEQGSVHIYYISLLSVVAHCLVFWVQSAYKRTLR